MARKRLRYPSDPHYYTKAGPVRITHPDGTVSEEPPLDEEAYARLIKERWPIPLRVRRQVFRRDGGLCRYCGAPGEEIDHIVPVALGGSNRLDNLVLSCHDCNSRKGAQVWKPRKRACP